MCNTVRNAKFAKNKTAKKLNVPTQNRVSVKIEFSQKKIIKDVTQTFNECPKA